MGFDVMTGFDPVYLNAGLMKPRKGLTLMAGDGNLGAGRRPVACIGRQGYANERKETLFCF